MRFICSVSMNIVYSINNLVDLYLLYFTFYKMTTKNSAPLSTIPSGRTAAVVPIHIQMLFKKFCPTFFSAINKDRKVEF
jgi:hypothetical protein